MSINFQGIAMSQETTLSQKYNDATKIKDKYTLDGAVLKRDEIKNPELDSYKHEPKDEIKIEIGDNSKVLEKGLLGAANTEDFVPSIKLSRWNEVSFKITPKDLDKVAAKDKTLFFEGDKIKYGTPKMSFEMYEATDTEEGGYKYIWYLNEKPASNIVEFQIETSGLDFFYQPPLNVENTDPNLTCTETQCKDKNGNIVEERPENVVGSYAVYYSTKGGMNDAYGKDYKVGKAFHIYRPHLIDANGLEAWGNLHIENGIYSVEIPQDFLDKAVYPIKSNDTFGYTTKGTAGDKALGSTNMPFGIRFDNASAGSISSFSACVRVDTGTKSAALGIYKITATNDLVDYSNAFNVTETTDTWKSANNTQSYSLIVSNNYYLAVHSDSVGAVGFFIAYDTGASYGYAYSSSNSWTSWPNPWSPTISGNKWIFSIYATYTPFPTPPTITNSSTTNIFLNSATLNANLTNWGNTTSTVHIYWGDNDGVTTTGNWDYDLNLGDKTANGIYSANISGLSKNTLYYYRAYVENASGTNWADNTDTFTTLSLSQIKFNWVFGMPAIIWSGGDSGTTSDAISWVLGRPTVVSSTTLASGGAPINQNPAGQFECQSGQCQFLSGNSIISLEDNLFKKQNGNKT